MTRSQRSSPGSARALSRILYKPLKPNTPRQPILQLVRRILVSVTLALLAVPAAALALGGAAGDGTLAVVNANGTISIAAKGALIGQIDRGRVTLEDPNPNDGPAPVVWGYESKRDLTDTKALYSGTDIRFRINGGFYRVKVVGSGLDLSVVGHGSVTLGPAANLVTAGTYSLNGTFPFAFPSVLTSLQLAAPSGP
jgi:hypothetical protein